MVLRQAGVGRSVDDGQGKKDLSIGERQQEGESHRQVRGPEPT